MVGEGLATCWVTLKTPMVGTEPGWSLAMGIQCVCLIGGTGTQYMSRPHLLSIRECGVRKLEPEGEPGLNSRPSEFRCPTCDLISRLWTHTPLTHLPFCYSHCFSLKSFPCCLPITFCSVCVLQLDAIIDSGKEVLKPMGKISYNEDSNGRIEGRNCSLLIIGVGWLPGLFWKHSHREGEHG